MELNFDRSQMLKAVNTAKTFAEGSSALKVLQSAFVSAGFGRVYLTATDLTLWCQVGLDARTPQPGTAAVPVRTLGTVLKTLPHSHVSLHTEGDDVCLAAGSSEVRITGFDADEYPDINPPQERLAAIPLPASLVNKVAYAVSNDETRYTLNGVHVEVGAAGLKLVATDGHRLARYTAAFAPSGEHSGCRPGGTRHRDCSGTASPGRRPPGFATRQHRDPGVVRQGGLRPGQRLGDAVGRPDRGPVPGL